jgi:competence ComEA-like helix-hairpin-helix protein
MPDNNPLKTPLVGMKTAVLLAAILIVGIAARTWVHESPVRPICLSRKINLNTASEALLQTLPNIGPARANAIVDYRRQHHGEQPVFRGLEDLQNVTGIGPRISEGLRPWITFETDIPFVDGNQIDGH